MRWYAAVVASALLAGDATACEVAARVDPDFRVAVAYDCPTGVRRLTLREPRSALYVSQVTSDGQQLLRDDEGWVLPPDRPARFNYVVNLGALARDGNSISTAVRVGNSILALLPSWLLEPRGPEGGVGVHLAVSTPPGLDFASGLPRQGNRYSVPSGDIWMAGYTVFGKLARHPIALPYPRDRGGQAVLEVVQLDGGFALPDNEIRTWIEASARNVATYFGGFPAPYAMLALVPVPGSRVRFGRVIPGGGVSILLQLGTEATREALYDDWVLIHELSHVSGPFLFDRGAWFMEGMATYVEPVIRARAGWRTPESVWREFANGMRRGLPSLTETGLINAGRDGIYWGGATFMLLADLEIRKRTQGRMGLEDVLGAVVWQHGNATLRWRTEQMIAACDQAAGFPVFAELAARFQRQGSALDLDALWTELGIEGAGDGLRLRGDAPAARWRDAITRNRS